MEERGQSTTEAQLSSARPLTVGRHVGRAAAVAVGGLSSFDVEVEQLHLEQAGDTTRVRLETGALTPHTSRPGAWSLQSCSIIKSATQAVSTKSHH